jgi:hypothetical protein
MRTGMTAVEKALKGGGTGGGTSGRYLSYFILADGDSKVIRFLTDMPDLAVADFYEFVIDKNGKFQNFVVPETGEDWVRKFGGKSRVFGSNELEDPRPRERIVGLAVEREEVPVEENGRRITRTQDKLSTFDSTKDSRAYDARNFLIVKQYSKFWNMIQGYYLEYGTICDRDYKITRTGTGRDIVYSVIPKAPDADWNLDGSSLAALRAQYGYGTNTDMDGNALTPDSEDRFLYCSQTLQQWMDNQASEERAKAALVGDDSPVSSPAPAPGWATGGPDEPHTAPAPATASSEVSSLRARLERHR